MGLGFKKKTFLSYKLQMKSRSFRFNPNGPTLFSTDPELLHESVFDYWSLFHFGNVAFFYTILLIIFKVKTSKTALKWFVVINVLHTIEEFLENLGPFNAENAFKQLFLRKMPDGSPNEDLKNVKDNDYLDNSIGDVISGIVGSGLVFLYWKCAGKVPYIVLLMPLLLAYSYYKTGIWFTNGKTVKTVKTVKTCKC